MHQTKIYRILVSMSIQFRDSFVLEIYINKIVRLLHQSAIKMHFTMLRRLFIEWHTKVPKLIDVYKLTIN